MLKSLNMYIAKAKKSKFLKDSFFAVFGNGIGQALLLVSGILIARLLGKDVYGEYGVAKTNMFYMAGFATFGLVYSSTRFIAKFIKEDKSQVIGIVRTSSIITLSFSSLIAVILVFFSESLADYLGTPDLSDVFRYLSVIIVLKALSSTGTGILSGLGLFKSIAINTLLSGGSMLVACVPLTYCFGLRGSLCSLLLSQLVNTITNYYCIIRECKKYPIYYDTNHYKELLKFSFPVALQEISYSICNWAGILFLTKLSSIGEVGIYSATAQWNAVILVIPGLLANVVLSHLSGSSEIDHRNNIRKIMLVYLICTGVPFIIVYFFTPFIVSMYGADYVSMGKVLRLMIFATIPTCCSDVFKAEFLAAGRPWLLFALRMSKDILFLGLTYLLLILSGGNEGSYCYALSNVCAAFYFFFALIITYIIKIRLK